MRCDTSGARNKGDLPFLPTYYDRLMESIKVLQGVRVSKGVSMEEQTDYAPMKFTTFKGKKGKRSRNERRSRNLDKSSKGKIVFEHEPQYITKN